MKLRHSTTLDGELLGVSIEMPVIVEYEYHQAVPGCGSSPPEREGVTITGLYVQNGLAVSVSISFVLNSMHPDKRARMAQQLLNEIKDDMERVA